MSLGADCALPEPRQLVERRETVGQGFLERKSALHYLFRYDSEPVEKNRWHDAPLARYMCWVQAYLDFILIVYNSGKSLFRQSERIHLPRWRRNLPK